MAQQGLSVNDVVTVSINLAPPAAEGESIDTMLIVGSSNVINTVERIRAYSSLEGVATDFPSTSPEYLASVLWFEQLPQPNELNIGRWAQVATSGVLVGGVVPPAAQLITAWTPITAGAFLANINGVPYAITGMNFGAVTNLNGVATVIQTALAAAVTGTTCVWDASYDVFRLAAAGSTGVSSSMGFLKLPTAVGSATFSANPANNDTLTIDGTTVTFVTAAPVGNQIQIAATLALTLQSLAAFLNSSADVNLKLMTYTATATALYIVSIATGTTGNAYTLTKTSTAITLSGATLAGGVTVSDDVSAMMQCQIADQVDGAYAGPGVAAETALAAVIALDVGWGTSWFGLTVLGAADTDVLSIANYVEGAGNLHYYGATTQEGGAITPGNTLNLASELSALSLNFTCCQYSSENPYAVVSYLARILTTNWAGNNTTITLKFKQEPGIVAEVINETQSQALQANNCNVFVKYTNGTAIIQQGVSCSGQYTDSIIGLCWLALEMQTNLYNRLYTSATKIPMTDAGNHVLATDIASTCDEGVNNGLIGPGVWEQGGFGTLSTGDYMKTGYYVYQPTVASMTASNRRARKSVPFQVAVNLAGAIHSASAAILVNS
jgi:hypothetical protein